STVDVEGRPNLAPFSYFNGISATPPLVMFACNAPDDRAEKDTLANVRATGEFVANLATWTLREAVNRSSDTVPHGVDEFLLAGVDKLPSRRVGAPQVAQSPVSMECRVMRICDFEPEQPLERRSSVVFGRVISIRVADGYLDEGGRFDVLKAAPIARLHGYHYLAARELFELVRPRGRKAA
ncbi:MAG TPA: flavin reductase family protein, partial [Caldimonas sp.]|nr:flavin reductase family protein [Caldimonas sp.]